MRSLYGLVFIQYLGSDDGNLNSLKYISYPAMLIAWSSLKQEFKASMAIIGLKLSSDFNSKSTTQESRAFLNEILVVGNFIRRRKSE